jgi:hypothetical protein
VNGSEIAVSHCEILQNHKFRWDTLARAIGKCCFTANDLKITFYFLRILFRDSHKSAKFQSGSSF